MKKRTIYFMAIFVMISIAPIGIIATEAPAGYSGEAKLDEPWIYSIEDSNGVVTYFDMKTFTSVSCATEVGGKIRFDFTGFYNDMPYFNMTFIKADGTINQTIANISNFEIAITLALSLGFSLFTPGIFTKSTDDSWEEQDNTARMIANGTMFMTSQWGSFYYNGTLKITSEKGLHTYEYKQDPKTFGNQNTTLVYDENTGVLQEFKTEFTGYHLSAAIESTKSGIDSYPLGFVLAFGVLSLMAIISRYKRK